MTQDMVVLVMFLSYVSHVRVKTADLKNNLSRYLKLVRESGEGIEVCLRDEPVAMLVPAHAGSSPGLSAQERSELQRRLAAAGLLLSSDPVAVGPLPQVTASRAGDRRADVRTVEAMRSERDW